MGRKNNLDDFFKKINAEQKSKDITNIPYFLSYPFMDWKIHTPITEKEYKNLASAHHKAIYSNQILQIMDIVIENYKEYISATTFKLKFKIESYHLKKALISRKLCNLLSSFYAYQELCAKYLHRIRPSPSFKHYKSKFITEKYLILQEVRNYAQHSGIPIHSISFNKNYTKIELSLNILLESKSTNTEILDNYKFNVIELSDLLESYIEALYQMHCEIVSDLPRTMSGLYTIINNAVNDMKNSSNNKVLKEVNLIKSNKAIPEILQLSIQFQEYFNFFNKKIDRSFRFLRKRIKISKPILLFE